MDDASPTPLRNREGSTRELLGRTMIVSHRHKFIFLKTRKTAGTSVEVALSRFCGDRDILAPIAREDEEIRRYLGYRGPQNFHIPLLKYKPANWAGLVLERRRPKYRNHMRAARVRSLVGEKVWNSYYKFCFERNPWDKAISLYYWRTKHQKPRPTLLEFLQSVSTSALSNLHIYSIDGEVAVDYVGLYEDLDFELEKLAARLKLPGRIELPKAKSNYREDKRNYRELMGPYEAEIVAKACAREAALFGYSS